MSGTNPWQQGPKSTQAVAKSRMHPAIFTTVLVLGITVFLVLASITIGVGVAIVSGDGEAGTSQSVQDDGTPSVGAERDEPDESQAPSASESDPSVHDESADDDVTPTPSAANETATKAPPKRPREYLVTRVIDGDTLELGNGETVRLIGIDAPERGACGSLKAADRLRALVQGKGVVLTEGARDDRDRYDRVLRYVNIGTMDAGHRLIKSGLAIARYDSRDGYGRHPREGRYIAADRANADITCPTPTPTPEPQPLAEEAPAEDCAPGYSSCVPPYPPDVNCADVNGPIRVTGSDPHGLDRDGDGIACE